MPPPATKDPARLAEVLLDAGKPKEALACADQALLQAPSSPHILTLRGRCLEAQGDVPGGWPAWQGQACQCH